MATWWQHGSFNTVKNAVLHWVHKKAQPYQEFFTNGSFITYCIQQKPHAAERLDYSLLISAGYSVKQIHTCFIFSPHMLPLTSMTKTMFLERGERSDGAKNWTKWPSDTWEIEIEVTRQTVLVCMSNIINIVGLT